MGHGLIGPLQVTNRCSWLLAFLSVWWGLWGGKLATIAYLHARVRVNKKFRIGPVILLASIRSILQSSDDMTKGIFFPLEICKC